MTTGRSLRLPHGVSPVHGPLDLPGEPQHQAGDDGDAAQKLPPMELLDEPHCGDSHAKHGLGEDGERGDVDRAFADDDEPYAVADGSTDDRQREQQAPGLGPGSVFAAVSVAAPSISRLAAVPTSRDMASIFITLARATMGLPITE